MPFSRPSLLILALLSLGNASALQIELPQQLNGKPNDFLSLPLRVLAGPGESLPDKLTLSTQLPEGWEQTSDSEVTLTNGEATLSFFLLEDARAGPQTLTLNLTADGVNLAGQTTVTVEAVSGVALQFPQRDVQVSRTRKHYPLTITNLGNHQDTYALSIEGDADLEQNRVTLAPNEQATINVTSHGNSIGNVSTVTISAVSLTNPAVTDSAFLALRLLQGSGNQIARDRPALYYQATAGLDSNVRDGQSSFGYKGSGVLSGKLSDSVDVYAQYLQQSPANPLLPTQDVALLTLKSGPWEVRAAAQERFGIWNVNTTRQDGDLHYDLGASRSLRLNLPYYALNAEIGSKTGWFTRYQRRFIDAGEDDVTIGWQQQRSNVRPGFGLRAARIGNQWGLGLEQTLAYENQYLLMAQNYRYDIHVNRHEMNVLTNLRNADPFSISAAAQFAALDGQLAYNVGSRLGYRASDRLRAGFATAAGSSGFSAELDAQYGLAFGWGDMNLTGAVGYADSLQYRLGLETEANSWSAAARYVGDMSGPLAVRVSTGFRYGPMSLTGAFETGRSRNWLQGYSLGAAWTNDTWSLGTFTQVNQTAGSFNWTAGAGVAARLIDHLNVNATATYGAGRTTFRLGTAYDLAGAFNTPDAIVSAFGGRNVGRLNITTYIDRNRNSKRDSDETAIPVELLVNGNLLRTNASGQLSTELPPGEYNVFLGPEVTATYALSQPGNALVQGKTTASLQLAIHEVGSIQGRIMTAHGKPAGNVRVNARCECGQQQAEATTDSSGFYRLGGLAHGTYELQVDADPDLYLPTGGVTLQLDTQHALITHDLTLQLQEAQTIPYSADALALSVELPEEELPPGVFAPVNVTTSSKADGVVAILAGTPTALESPDGTRWTGAVFIPQAMQGGTELTFTARAGKEEATERAFLPLNAELPVLRTNLVPMNALPGQYLTVKITYYGNAKQLELRDASGKAVSLDRTGRYAYSARLQAQAQSGRHQLTLFADGQEAQQIEYVVLGRP